MSVTTRQIAALVVLVLALGLAAACGVAACETCETGHSALAIDSPLASLLRLGAACAVAIGALSCATAVAARAYSFVAEASAPAVLAVSPLRI